MHILSHILKRGVPACVAWAVLAAPAAWGQAIDPCAVAEQSCQPAPACFPYVPCPTLQQSHCGQPAPRREECVTTDLSQLAPGDCPTAAGHTPTFNDKVFATADVAIFIDSAIPRTTFRLRFDAAYDESRPDRAEFFWGKSGSFRASGADPHAPGPPLRETDVDYQDILAYFEYAPTCRFSFFAEVPWRFLNPDENANTNGLADITVGAKAALVRDRDQVLSAEIKGYIPAGDSDRGLGTHHYSVEPGLLYFRRLTERAVLNAECRYWISTGGTDFSGSVLRYGAGLGYDLAQGCNWKITPVAEFIGWTALSGKESTFNGQILSAGGDTIVNAVVGTRFFFGDHSSIAASYGRALTGDTWYREIYRLEYRWQF